MAATEQTMSSCAPSSAALLKIAEAPKPVVFELKEPVGVVERLLSPGRDDRLCAGKCHRASIRDLRAPPAGWENLAPVPAVPKDRTGSGRSARAQRQRSISGCREGSGQTKPEQPAVLPIPVVYCAMSLVSACSVGPKGRPAAILALPPEDTWPPPDTLITDRKSVV